MDFFEKAHVVKKDSSRKENKSEEAVKKHLKQMLYGYKQSDSKLLKSCEEEYEPLKLNDDSSSVSGFSDLNLTHSSNEADTTHGTAGSDADGDVSDVEEVSCSKISDSLIFSSISDVSSETSEESFSEFDDNNITLSDNMPQDVALETYSDSSENTSIISSITGTVSEKDTDDSAFDPDGDLASKILEKLENTKIAKKTKKRKSETTLQSEKTVPSTKHDQNVIEKKQVNKQLQNLKQKFDDYDSKDSINDSDSPAFISVEASDMLDQSLGEILGGYRHSTMKNLPSEIQVTHLSNNSGTFSIEDMNVEDIQIQEEVGSLTPEYDHDNNLDDFDIGSTDHDISTFPLTESPSLYHTTLQSDPTSEKEISLDSVEDNYKSPVKVFYANNSCIFVLKYPTELFINGKLQVKALGGTIEVFGHVLQDDPCEIYAPNYNYAYCINTVCNHNLYKGLFSKLTAEGLHVSEAEDIVTELGEHDAVISLSKITSCKMEFIENNMTSTDLFSKINKNVDSCFKKASEILGCSLFLTRPWKIFEEVTCWRKVAEYGLKNQSRGIICGGKGVGKSTFLRYCVNKMLSRGPVLVIDLDPGQAEFTVAGNISATVVDSPLLGPNFTHLKTPHRMLNLGMINTMDNPRRYAAAVSALITHCCNNEQLKAMPWIINTMGFCNAMGLKFMTLTIVQAQPTYVLQIDSKNPKKRFEMFLDSLTTNSLYRDRYRNDPLFRNLNRSVDCDYAFFVAHHADNPIKKSYSLPQRDERYLNFLAYFGGLLTTQHKNELLGIVPYEVKLGDLHIGLNIRISEDAVTQVINGKIVALCQLTMQDKGGDVFTLRDKPVLCHGHGLVRSVDLEKQTLYIITPIPVEKLSLINTLVYADWVPEMRGQEMQLPDGVTVPYRTAPTYQKRQLMYAPRRRFNPLQLLKMSRNS